MPYDGAYSLYFEDRAIGQSPAKGYSLNNRFPFETPWAFQYFNNRAVGQSTMPMSKSKMFNEYNISPQQGYSDGGWTQPKEPMPYPYPTTTIYSTDAADAPRTNGLKLHHMVALGVVAAILLIVVFK